MPGRHITDRQARLYMNLRSKDTPSVAAAKASISTATAYRIESDPRLPSQIRTARTRRRPDPLDGIFDEEVVPMLEHTPHLRAVTIFEDVGSGNSGRCFPEILAGRSRRTRSERHGENS